jgi:O-acetyl-ADP-ribose deacetylase
VREIKIGPGRLRLLHGDITKLGRRVGAIVSASNEELRADGGVSAAIHQAAGREIDVECRWIGRTATGKAVATTAGALDADAVIHAVGPIWSGGRANEEKLLSSAYRSALGLADHHGLTSIAFPSLSTGLYGFPIERAAHVAIGTTAAFLRRAESVREVILVQFTDDDHLVYSRTLDRLAQLQAARTAQLAAMQAQA